MSLRSLTWQTFCLRSYKGNSDRGLLEWIFKPRRIEGSSETYINLIFCFVLFSGTFYVLNFSLTFCNKLFNKAILEYWRLLEVFCIGIKYVLHSVSLIWESWLLNALPKWSYLMRTFFIMVTVILGYNYWGLAAVWWDPSCKGGFIHIFLSSHI